jgi:hypothetical protein
MISIFDSGERIVTSVCVSWHLVNGSVALNDELAPFIGCHVFLRPNDFVTCVLDLQLLVPC